MCNEVSLVQVQCRLRKLGCGGMFFIVKLSAASVFVSFRRFAHDYMN